MKRRGFIRLLSIVIALLLPVSAMAQGAAKALLEQANTDGKEIVSTVTFEPGAGLAADQIVTDLCAATALRCQKLPDGFGALAISLSGTDVFSAQMRTETDGIYVKSEVLGDKPLYFTWDDLKTFMAKSMQSSGTSDQAVESFTQGFTQAINQMTAMGETSDKQMMTEEEVKQQIIQAMGGDESFVNWINGIEAKQVVTKGEFTLGDSDVADTKTELLITMDDIIAMMDTQYVKDQITKQLKTQDSTLTDEQLAAQTAEAIATAKTEMADSDIAITATVYSVGETKDFVASLVNVTGTFTPSDVTAVQPLADMTVQATTDTATTADAGNLPFKMDITVQAVKKTTEAGTLYTLDVTAVKDDTDKVALNANLNIGNTSVTGALAVLDKDGKSVLTLALGCDYQDPNHVTASLDGTVVVDDTQTAFMLGMDQTVTDTTVNTVLSLSTGESFSAIKADAAAALLGTLKINTVVQDDSGYFTTLGGAKPETSLELAKLSDDEMSTYVTSLNDNLNTLMGTVLQNLPASVFNAMTSATSN
ncbi:MAG: hypothetical protein LLF96_11855 [Eubacteriales bacterium]|nr:hypothetical protein [Eubacteriales bacterium]